MGVDAILSLPAAVQVDHVAMVVARLYGHTAVRIALGGSAEATNVDGYSVRVLDSIPTLVQILVALPREVDGVRIDSFNYHFEGPFIRASNGVACTVHDECRSLPEMGRACWNAVSQPAGRRLLTQRSRPLTIAVMRRVADFFGGIVDHQDCDSSYADHVVADKAGEWLEAADGEEFQTMHDRIAAVAPLTAEDVRACVPLAAYSTSDHNIVPPWLKNQSAPRARRTA